MTPRPATIAGCRVAELDAEQHLSEAYCVLTILSLHIMESEGRSKVADEVMANALDAVATLVGLTYAETIR